MAKEEKQSLWDEYDVQFDFITRVCASTPAAPDLIQRWLEARQPRVKPPGGKTIQEINEEVFQSLPEESLTGEVTEEETQQTLLVFQRHDGNLCVRASTVRAHIKDCARQLSSMHIGKIKGEKSFAVRVVNGVYPEGYWLPLLRAQKPVDDPDGTVTRYLALSQPDGTYEKPVHAIGPRGIRINALKEIEFVECPTLRFGLKVLHGSVKEEDLRTIFEYGCVHGYGGERGDGEGRYEFELQRRGDGTTESTSEKARAHAAA